MEDLNSKLHEHKAILLNELEQQSDPICQVKNIYKKTLKWMAEPDLSPKAMLFLLSLAKDTINITSPGENEIEKSSARMRLGIDAAESLAKRQPKDLTGPWEAFVWELITLITDWDPNIDGQIDYSNDLLEWLLLIINSPSICSNLHLRLELIRFFEILPPTKLSDVHIGSQLTSGLISAACKLEIDQMLTQSKGPSLALPFLHVLRLLRIYGYLQPVALAAIDQLEALKLGVETYFIAHIINLSGNLSGLVSQMYINGSWQTFLTIMMFQRSVNLLEQIAGLSPFSAICQLPGITQLTARSIICILESIVQLKDLCIEKFDAIQTLLFRIDNILHTLSTPINPPYQLSPLDIMQKDHSQQLIEIDKRLNDLKLILNNLPKTVQEKKSEDCPPEFLDAVTHSMMHAPIRLKTSGEVIDVATLIILLLEEDPRDPFTRSPLNDHQNTFSHENELYLRIKRWLDHSNVEKQPCSNKCAD